MLTAVNFVCRNVQTSTIEVPVERRRWCWQRRAAERVRMTVTPAVPAQSS